MTEPPITLLPPAPPAAPPHPPLAGYYGEAARRQGFVRQLFDDSAAQYDRINRILSLGSGAWYRRQALRGAGLRQGDRVLDVATGTGLVAREAARLTGDPALVLGLDPSPGMLAEARRSLASPMLQGRAEQLPLADASIDFLSMGYGLRHIADLPTVFAEFRRVLRPGGRLLLLEFGRPRGRLAQAATRAYLGRVVPALCRLATPRDHAGILMRYTWDTIDSLLPAEAILGHLAAAGFAAPHCETRLGLFRAYQARRPEGDAA